MAASKKTQPVTGTYHPKQLTCPRCGEITRASAHLCKSCSYVFSARDRRLLVSGGSRAINGGPRGRKPNEACDESDFVREMAERGFKYVRHVDGITGKLVRTEDDPKIEKLGLEFGAIPWREAEGVYVTRTSPQIQVAMSLDKFLELTGIKP